MIAQSRRSGTDAARGLAGALLVDKPVGPTSHDVVAVVRRALKTSRVGHTGTLDPLASGLLVVLVGAATRLAQFLAVANKEYLADIRLGVSTPTYDAASLADGVRSTIDDGRWRMRAELEAALEKFRGSFLQTPPPYSAKKVAGVAAYEKARRQEAVDLKPVVVTVHELEILGTSSIAPRPSRIGDPPSAIEQPALGTSDIGHATSDIGPGDLLRLRIAATAGFYVRSLAHDLGQALGCGAHLEGLRRTRVGRFQVEDALTLDQLEPRGAASVTTCNALLGEMPSAVLTETGSRRVAHGNPVGPQHAERYDSQLYSDAGCDERLLVRLVDASGTLVAVAEQRRDGFLHPVVVLG